MKIDIRNFSENDSEVIQDVEIKFDNALYAAFYPEKAHIKALIDKFGNDYLIKVHLETVAHFVCDSCLEPFNEKIVIDYEHIYQVGHGDLEISEDVQTLPADTTEIDISELLTEMILLNHPIKMKCSKDCKGLCPECGINLNVEICSCADGKIDQRWESLRKLIK
jgi:uncharacterized protein